MTTIAATTAPALLAQTYNGVPQRARSRVTAALSIVLLAGLASGVEAADDVQLIDQDLALAGGVTPGDLPGFPVEISRPGSYRLSGNLRVSVPGVHPIIIRADNVTIDLNGFTIQGPFDQCFRRLIPTWCMVAPSLGNGVGVSACLRMTTARISRSAMGRSEPWSPPASGCAGSIRGSSDSP